MDTVKAERTSRLVQRLSRRAGHAAPRPGQYRRGLERTICDYIAGMTDRFAVQEHQKLFDPATLP
jgi:dGTPase